MNGRPRILSLDALRGFDMVWLIGLAAAVRAFCGTFPGGEEWWLARQMHHCSWEGFVLALGAFCFAWLFLWLLYRAKIFIKA
ncbi:MAG: hypothetical protein IKO72_03025 [Kiritimatiellae bacterium]|nr:hypothetical protein [Kiritimatiellia bacterium]